MTTTERTVLSAVLSACGTYRYELRRTWGDGPVCGWIMLNPSTADGEHDDPTIRRCLGFARSWGYTGIVVRNLYALRATNPRALRAHHRPVGDDNDTHLLGAVTDQITVCAWGTRGERGDAVINALSDARADLRHLALTRAGKPRHPLYLPSHLTPIPFAEHAARRAERVTTSSQGDPGLPHTTNNTATGNDRTTVQIGLQRGATRRR